VQDGEQAAVVKCERNTFKLSEMEDDCLCNHPITTYESRSGTRCRCCFGAVPAAKGLSDG
jgi:hypothetical protein